MSTVSTCSGHNEIETIKTISRFPIDLDCSGYDLYFVVLFFLIANPSRLLSDDLPDWYSTENSDRFTKEIRYFTGDIFIDATEWGELLALSGADYLQGIAEQYDGDTSGIGNDTCGQVVCSLYCSNTISRPLLDLLSTFMHCQSLSQMTLILSNMQTSTPCLDMSKPQYLSIPTCAAGIQFLPTEDCTPLLLNLSLAM